MNALSLAIVASRNASLPLGKMPTLAIMIPMAYAMTIAPIFLNERIFYGKPDQKHRKSHIEHDKNDQIKHGGQVLVNQM